MPTFDEKLEIDKIINNKYKHPYKYPRNEIIEIYKTITEQEKREYADDINIETDENDKFFNLDGDLFSFVIGKRRDQEKDELNKNIRTTVNSSGEITYNYFNINDNKNISKTEELPNSESNCSSPKIYSTDNILNTSNSDISNTTNFNITYTSVSDNIDSNISNTERRELVKSFNKLKITININSNNTYRSVNFTNGSNNTQKEINVFEEVEQESEKIKEENEKYLYEYEEHKLKIDKYFENCDMKDIYILEYNNNIFYKEFSKLKNTGINSYKQIFNIMNYNTIFYIYEVIKKLKDKLYYYHNYNRYKDGDTWKIIDEHYYWYYDNNNWKIISKEEAYKKAKEFYKKYLESIFKEIRIFEYNDIILNAIKLWDKKNTNIEGFLDKIFKLLQSKNYYLIEKGKVSLDDKIKIEANIFEDLDYKEVIQKFIKQKLIITENIYDKILSKDLYQIYIQWCEIKKYRSTNNSNFGKQIKQNNISTKRVEKGTIYLYIKLI